MKSSDRTAQHYDAILIGSGMGALTVASLLAQFRHQRVLILERHFKAGGFTHAFKRQGYHWDVGLHYVGQMNPESPLRKLFDLIARGSVKWNKMPEPFEKFVYPEFEFELYGEKERFKADLVRRFPEEKAAIQQYFRDLAKASRALWFHTMRSNGSWLFKLLGWWDKLWNPISLELTTRDYLDRHFKNPDLKALLVSQWGDYGVPPAQSPFAVHATIAQHYLDGGYYPVGGAGTIAESVVAIVKEYGGEVLLNREVTEILIEGDRAVGVRSRKVNAKDDVVETYYAPIVISNAGSATTYLKLIPDDYPIPFRSALRQFLQQHPPTTNVTLYLGLSGDPRQLGFRGENHWIYEDIDHDRAYASRSEWIEAGKPRQAYLSFPSLKDPEAKAHTAEIITWADYEQFSQWREQPWLHRDEAYQHLKERISQQLIEAIDRHYPGFGDLVTYRELSTPITNEHFTGHIRGGIYGLPAVSERFQPQNAAWTTIETPVKGLFLTGADAYLLGISGAMMAGVVTLSRIPGGVSIPKTFSKAFRS